MRARHRTVLLITLLGVAAAVPALAQSGQPYPPACAESKVSKQDNDRAHTLFLDGKQSLQESSYDAAIALFREAYRVNCSVHGILPILATAYERKGDRAEAVRALEEYLKRVPDAPERETIERRIKNLKEQMGTSPTLTSPATTTASTATVPTATASATAPPTASETATATAPTGSGTEQPPSGHSAFPWVLVGVGGVAVATGVALFVVGAGDVSSAESKCNGANHTCPPGDTTDENKGNTGRTLEGVGIAVGAVGVAAAAIGLYLHFSEKPREQGPSAPPSAAIAPAIGPGYAGVSVGGRF